jgi:hypothetical protein
MFAQFKLKFKKKDEKNNRLKISNHENYCFNDQNINRELVDN